MAILTMAILTTFLTGGLRGQVKLTTGYSYRPTDSKLHLLQAVFEAKLLRRKAGTDYANRASSSAVCHARLEPQASRRGPGQVLFCYSHVCASYP